MAEKLTKIKVENNPDRWTDDERQEFLTKGFRSLRDDETPVVTNVVRPGDYDNDLKRGTVKHDPAFHNYSFMRVVVPDGAVISDTNFAQASPNTETFVAEGSLRLVRCNLVNVRLDPAWVVVECNTAQTWLYVDENGTERRKYICRHPDELKGNEKAPDTVLVARDY